MAAPKNAIAMNSRRKFLQNSMLLTGGLLAQHAIGAPFINRRKPRVVIIGAGFAGLAAARVLHRAGASFTILESRNRIGGRVFSFNAVPEEKLVIELGAEWIGASHEHMLGLCQEYKLTVENNQLDSHLVYKGKYYPKNEWNYSTDWLQQWKQLAEGYQQLSDRQRHAIDQMDWWRYLDNHGCTGMDMDLRELLDSTDFGESIRHVSAYAALAGYAEASEKNEMDYKIKGGNGKLAEAMALEVGTDHIKLQHAMSRVEQQRRGAVVHCTNGTRFEADFVICTAPTHAVKKIAWEPGLPADTQAALNALQYARINKHPILFRERFWKDEAFDMVTDLPAHYFYHATKNQTSPKGILISYTIGDKAAVVGSNATNDAWHAAMAADGLRPAFGNVAGLMEKHWNYYWGEDAYSHGAYASYKPGQWFTLMPILRRSHMRTHFAGEHLADWQGFMEGALITGEEAALKVVKG